MWNLRCRNLRDRDSSYRLRGTNNNFVAILFSSLNSGKYIVRIKGHLKCIVSKARLSSFPDDQGNGIAVLRWTDTVSHKRLLNCHSVFSRLQCESYLFSPGQNSGQSYSQQMNQPMPLSAVHQKTLQPDIIVINLQISFRGAEQMQRRISQ